MGRVQLVGPLDEREVAREPRIVGLGAEREGREVTREDIEQRMRDYRQMLNF